MNNYNKFSDLFSALSEIATATTGYGDYKYLYEFVWSSVSNLNVEYFIWEGETLDENDSVLEVIISVHHSTHALKHKIVMFKDLFSNYKDSLLPHDIIMRYVENPKKYGTVENSLSVKKSIFQDYLSIYGDGYSFDNFKKYALTYSGYKDFFFNATIGTKAYLNEDNEKVLTLFRVEICLSINILVIDVYCQDYSYEDNRWSHDMRRKITFDDSIELYFLKESANLNEFIYVVEPKDSWYEEECEQLKQLVKYKLT